MPTVYHTPGVYFERRQSPPPVTLPRTDIAGFVGIAMRGPLFDPIRIESWLEFVSVFGDHLAQAYLAYAVQGFFANGGRRCWIARVADPTTARTASRTFGSVVVAAGTPGSWGNGIFVRPSLVGTSIAGLSIRFPDGSLATLRSPFGASLPIDNLYRIKQEDIDVAFSRPPLVTAVDSGFVSGSLDEGFLSGGSDGLATLTPAHFEDGFKKLAKISEIAIVAAPDLQPKLRVPAKFRPVPPSCCCDASPVPMAPPPSDEFPTAFGDAEVQQLQQRLLAQCYALRYRFAVLDAGGERIPPPAALKWREDLGEWSYGALYYPWLLVDDPLRLTGLVRAVPPSGHVSGVFARVDWTRGVHKPPMNEVIEAASDARLAIDDTDHGILNDSNVNALRVLPGRGLRVMGARTLWEDILYRYVNVRRLLSMIEKAIDTSLTGLVFDPNNIHLWSTIDRSVRSFLEALFRAGMLDGATSADAYTVRCDDKTNPPEETDQGRVICEIGLRPPYPAEFVVVTLGITKDGVEIREGGPPRA